MSEDDRCPGREEATKHGYSLTLTIIENSFNGDRKCSATYTKGRLSLTIKSNKDAELFSIVGLVKLSIEPFGFPNKNFEKFEQAILKLLPAEEE